MISLFNKLATKAQKDKYLSKLTTEYSGSFALSEPTSGSDAFALKTTAKKDGNSYILNGTKMWISNSDLSGCFLIMANVDTSKGYKGITTFIVEREYEGFSVGKKEDKLGIRASGTCMLHLENVRVPEENVLVEVGLRTDIVLPLRSQTMSEEEKVLEIWLDDRRLTVHAPGLNLLLYEFLDPRTWARGIYESLTRPLIPGEPALIFANEASTWANSR